MSRRAMSCTRGIIIILSSLTAGCPVPTPTVPSIHYSNIGNVLPIESGFVVGTAAGAGSAIVLVEVKVDGGAYEPASGAESWRYKLPTGVFAWKQGSIHTVTARARDAQGNVSAERTVIVVKGRNRDVDGDGYADLAVGAPSFDAKRGRVYLFRGGPSGIASIGAGSACAILTGGGTDNQFGYSVALDDVDGNGYADLIVGAPMCDAHQGKVYVFYGSSSGIASSSADSAYTILTGETSGSWFGLAIGAGHVDGDDCADLLVGAFNCGSGQGRAYLFLGSPPGISSKAAAAADTILAGDAASSFGWAVALGDVNGDGYDDAAIGAPNSAAGQGRIFLFLGSASGISGTGTADADTALSGESGAFGYTVALGDANGDGFADMAAGAPGYDSDRGRAYVFLGSFSGIADADAGEADTVVSGEAGSMLGCALAFGDANGDSYADLLVGAAFYDNGGSEPELGRAYVFQGSASGIASAAAAAAGTVLTGASEKSDFGISTAFVDANGDGYADIAVGACCSLQTDDGRAYVFHGGPSGITSRDAGSANTALVGENAVDGFAWALSP